MHYDKIAPGLRAVCSSYQRSGRAGLKRHARTFGLMAKERSPKPARAVVFVHCDPKAPLQKLKDLGIKVNQAAGRVRTAFLPLECLATLADEPGVKRIAPARYLRKRLDIASAKVDLTTFRQTSQLTGKDVVVGVIDSGIDPKHPSFKTRIHRIWDQTISGPGVAEGDYGLEVKGSQLSASRDTDGHGTHVAGIAAGKHTQFGGVAPAAKLVIVKSDLLDAHIADGIRYIFRIAKGLGLPAVINLSIGGHGDAHDGTDSLSLVIDEESGPGRIVCCAAGNEGDENVHAQVQIPRKKGRILTFSVPKDSVESVIVNGWYSGADKLEVAVAHPSGISTGYQPIAAGEAATQVYEIKEAEITVTTQGPDPANGDHNILVEIESTKSAKPVPAGKWKLLARNVGKSSARLDAWVIDDSEVGQQVFFMGKGVVDALKIGSPGSALSAITVGSYTTRAGWTDRSGDGWQVGDDEDEMTAFSSEGPLRNGVKKPDLAAPGAMIISAMSADSAPEPSDVIDDHHVVMGGTSMATPFVSGLVALLLERKPSLDPAAVKKLLLKQSRIPGKAKGAFNPTWGFGLIGARDL
jgi:subtilisin family serine protease